MKFDFIFYFFFSFIIVFFQSSPYFNENLLIYNIKVNIIFLLTIYAYIRYQRNLAIFYGFFMGLVCDLFSNSIFGMYATSFLLSSTPILIFRNYFTVIETPIYLLFIICCSLLKAIILFLIVCVILNVYSGFKYLIQIGLLETLINSLAAIPTFFILKLVFNLVDTVKYKLTS